MATKIRVGMVGITPDRGFSSIAHMPALLALPDFEVVAVCTTRQASADAAAKHYGAAHAFADPVKLAQHPDVDLVTVCVSVPGHLDPVMAAIDAGKHVYSEWPLGRTTEEAIRMRDAAAAKGVRHAVGLQGRVSPSINYVRDLIAGGHIGKPLSATLLVNAGNWGATIDRAYQTAFANGANLMTITSTRCATCWASSASCRPFPSASATRSRWKGPARWFPRTCPTNSWSAASRGTARWLRCRCAAA